MALPQFPEPINATFFLDIEEDAVLYRLCTGKR